MTRYYRSAPRTAQGGIRLQSSRGAVGTTWWGKRWVAALERLCDQGRLSRGRSYARQGQVLTLEIQSGRVLAKVQGSRPKPYTVSIELPLLSADAWDELIAELSESPLQLAQMLAGEMPKDLERIFEGAGHNLFPTQRHDLDTDCSCPDWSDPCKHSAAVYYLLAEQFDADPFLLLRLRGIEREQLMSRLGTYSHDEEPEPIAVTPLSAERIPLPIALAEFWQGGPLPPLSAPQSSALIAPLLRRLKSPPLWRGLQRVYDTLAPIYEAAVPLGQRLFELDGDLMQGIAKSAQSLPLERKRGRPKQAEPMLLEAPPLGRPRGRPKKVAATQGAAEMATRSGVAHKRGRPKQAEPMLPEALPLGRPRGRPKKVAVTQGAAEVATRSGVAHKRGRPKQVAPVQVEAPPVRRGPGRPKKIQ